MNKIRTWTCERCGKKEEAQKGLPDSWVLIRWEFYFNGLDHPYEIVVCYGCFIKYYSKKFKETSHVANPRI